MQETGGVAEPKASAGEITRFHKRYIDEVRAKLTAEFGYKNLMQVPRLEKIVINMGVGEATGDQKKLDCRGRRTDADRGAEAGEDGGQEGDRRI